jgi:hypothetical protein
MCFESPGGWGKLNEASIELPEGGGISVREIAPDKRRGRQQVT